MSDTLVPPPHTHTHSVAVQLIIRFFCGSLPFSLFLVQIVSALGLCTEQTQVRLEINICHSTS